MELRLDDDFRSSIEAAVAYRITEMFNVPPEEARRRVQDFSRHGLTAEHRDQVLMAGYDLFKPMIGAAFPVIRTLLNATITGVQAQVQRGQEAERDANGRFMYRMGQAGDGDWWP